MRISPVGPVVVILSGGEPLRDAVRVVTLVAAGEPLHLAVVQCGEIAGQDRGGQRLESDALARERRLVTEDVRVDHRIRMVDR
jgi:hypothetical protein